VSAVVLTGPTASGKTSVSLALARRIPLEIISMDSRMVYSGMDIGTAKPSPEERRTVPHHLLDIRDPDQPYSVHHFLSDVRTLVPQIVARGRLPLIVGGTLLYLKALLSGWRLGPPPFDDAERHRLLAEEAWNPGSLFLRAIKVNPVRAHRLSPKDYPRLIRAIEGAPPAASPSGPPFHLTVFCLSPSRELAYRRVSERVHDQISRGLVDEVRALVDRYHDACRALRAIAYQEFLPYFRSEISLDTAIERLKRNNRRLVKHQLTWLRQIPYTPIPVAESSDPETLADILHRLLATPAARNIQPRRRGP
jgi:tRNA dimethylallyltransferase